MTSRNYCFTSYSNEEVQNLTNWDKTKYICWGLEICPTTGKEHLQGYIELNEPIRITGFKSIAPTTHFEKRQGTQQQAIDYCRKDGLFEEHGEIAKQGNRADLVLLKQSLDAQMDLKSISEEHFNCFMKYNKSIKDYINLHATPRDWETNLEIHIGGPGSGKSHYCKTQYPDAYWMMKPNGSSVFFDGYTGQDTIILDEFYGWIPWDLLLRLADKYCLTLQTKGASVNCQIKNLIITSNKPVYTWYPNIDDIDPLIRRITLYKDDYISHKFVDKQKFDAMKSKILNSKNTDSRTD